MLLSKDKNEIKKKQRRRRRILLFFCYVRNKVWLFSPKIEKEIISNDLIYIFCFVTQIIFLSMANDWSELNLMSPNPLELHNNFRFFSFDECAA